jgi:RNA polymerase sigma factor (sigma-70 family)
MNVSTATKQIAYTDDEVIVRVLTGQPALFELLVRRTNPLLYRVGRSFGFNHHDTEDLMQEAHVDAYLNLASFERRSAYGTWVTRLMINRCAQRLRKRSYSNEIPSDALPDNASPVYQSNHSESPDAVVMKNELSRLVETALAQMPANLHVVFTLRELNQQSVTETAEALGISETNVKVRLNRAKAELRKKLEEAFDPQDIYEFNLVHCDGIVNRVMERIQALSADGVHTSE